MTTFVIACVGLVVFSGLFFLFPRRRSGSTEAELDAANLAWYRQRKQELESQGESVLLEDARLRLFEDERRHDEGRPELGATTRFSAWLLLPLVGLGAGLLYYELGAAVDVELAQRLQGLGESSSPSEMRQLISDVEQRSIKRPDNLHYLALLGRYYIGQQEYDLARENYRQMLREVPEDAQILAYSAQAEFFAAGRTLTDEARLRAEQALAVDPQQRTALGMLGMAFYEQGDFRAAIGYWERLLAMETPGSENANMIRSVLDSARMELGEEVAEPNTQAEP
ncbi:MAG: tetratricopeptide repeat protein, partial [Halieaceae bacterium]|nr:tetratricopeptide repeat protein [Halieaceae bacterium]